ncbi:hypothetical protein COCNU_09G005820 [Cocos nucifera]|uniref:Uncharacterized protein n=1 Tax=Cocos nucifera TaxID=13894 RepID=A0A8K0IKG5_COCNU|nr:hypothetical protein COCNU_09G005820 [Cocos nucifera]
MVRKRRTEPSGSGESSQSAESSGSGGRGGPQHLAQRAPAQQQQGGGRGWGPAPQQSQQGGRGRGYYQGRGGGAQPRGGMSPQQQGAPASEYQGRGGPFPRGGMQPQQHYGGRRGGGSMAGGHGVGPSAGPSRPPAPELHQAMQAPYQAAQASSSQASSSRQTEMSAAQMTQQFQELSVESETTPSQAIQPVVPLASSSKSLRFPLRPGKGSFGDKCVVKANHFFAELPDKDLHQYDVSIKPEVISRGVNRAVMEQLVRLYRQSYLGGRLPAYDGRKSLYTAGPLPFTSREFQITLIDEDDGSGTERRQRTFNVVIKLAARADLHHLELFLAGRQADAPQEALQVLDIVLRELPTMRYSPVGRSFYSPHLGRRQPLDMSSTAFIEPLPVIDFVTQLLNRDVQARPLSDADRVKIKKALRGVKVEVTHRGNMRRKYRISGLTSQATRELTFPVDERGTMKSVVQYFQETYGFTIQHTNLPCLQVGNQQRPNYLPMEVCKIVEGQRYSKRLNERQITALLKVTCQRPQERERDIIQVGGRNTVLVDALSRRIPLVSDRPTIIFGADVTHPHPGEDSSPSIAAVVASQDWPEVTKYAGLVSAQAHRQELIQDLFKVWQDPQRGTVTGGMIKELLISFKKATGQKPQRIIFYRDGVSEGQFYQVLLYELDAIRKVLHLDITVACASLEPNYQPPVTFVVVQKRHHTRLFANNHRDTYSVDKSGNILPGTVVDSKICHPTEFDFYLCSHAGIQFLLIDIEILTIRDVILVKGTSRPAHYHVLWDENKFTADALQTLTNNLCYTYARCTRSVSIGKLLVSILCYWFILFQGLGMSIQPPMPDDWCISFL